METTTKAGKARQGIQGAPAGRGRSPGWYAKITRKDLEEFRRLRPGSLAGRIGAGVAVLEVAPGPGYLAIELAKLGPYRVAALDISRSFVRMAAENARKAGVPVDFRHGDAAATCRSIPTRSSSWSARRAPPSRTSASRSTPSTRCSGSSSLAVRP